MKGNLDFLAEEIERNWIPRDDVDDLLTLIQAYCGDPDPSNGCRSILKAIKEFEKK